MINKQGGTIPVTESEMQRAKNADLITLPMTVKGTNCFNCKFIDKRKKTIGFCTHEKVQQNVTNRQCCSFWDAKGSIRPWEKK